jgi:hypothetical protein
MHKQNKPKNILNSNRQKVSRITHMYTLRVTTETVSIIVAKKSNNIWVMISMCYTCLQVTKKYHLCRSNIKLFCLNLQIKC